MRVIYIGSHFCLFVSAFRIVCCIFVKISLFVTNLFGENYAGIIFLLNLASF